MIHVEQLLDQGLDAALVERHLLHQLHDPAARDLVAGIEAGIDRLARLDAREALPPATRADSP